MKRIFLGVATLAIAALTAQADTSTNSVTLRTTGFFVGLTQGTNPVSGRLRYDGFDFAGHNLVNLAMGRQLTDTNFPNQVLATTFDCDLSSAELVVYDLSTSNVVADIGSSTSLASVKQQDTNAKGPNRAHFVAYIQLTASGNNTNGIADGYFTVAGRVNLNPSTGCPEPILVFLDRDPLDRLVDDVELPASLDRDAEPLLYRAGLAHLIGVVDAVSNGSTNTVLVPYGGLSFHRDLSGTSTTTTPPPTAAVN